MFLLLDMERTYYQQEYQGFHLPIPHIQFFLGTRFLGQDVILAAVSEDFRLECGILQPCSSPHFRTIQLFSGRNHCIRKAFDCIQSFKPVNYINA